MCIYFGYVTTKFSFGKEVGHIRDDAFTCIFHLHTHILIHAIKLHSPFWDACLLARRMHIALF